VASTALSVDPDAVASLGLVGMNVNEDAPERVAEIVDLITSGAIRAPQTTTYSLDNIATAIATQATRHVAGKTILMVAGTAGIAEIEEAKAVPA